MKRYDIFLLFERFPGTLASESPSAAVEGGELPEICNRPEVQLPNKIQLRNCARREPGRPIRTPPLIWAPDLNPRRGTHEYNHEALH